MILRRRKRVTRNWRIFTDGAIRPELGLSGLAVVVYDERGTIALWWYRIAGKMTCNEAEYAAAIFGFDQLLPFRPLVLELYSDSQIMVQQMRGEAIARAPALRQMQSLLRERVAAFEQVTFHHVSREENRVTDALAYEAIARELKAKGGQDLQCAKNLLTDTHICGR